MFTGGSVTKLSVIMLKELCVILIMNVFVVLYCSCCYNHPYHLVNLFTKASSLFSSIAIY